MRIGILGSGLMGSALGRAWARRGHHITFSYARDFRRLERLATEAGSESRAGSPSEAADADVVLIAVPWHRLDDLLSQTGSLSGRIVVSCSLPMTPDDSGLALGHTTSGAETLAARPELAGAQVVSAFNTVPSELITALSNGQRAADGPPSVLYCGDDDAAKQVAATLIRDAGFVPTDAGPLDIARYLEPFGLLVAQLAYTEGANPALGYRFVSVTPDSRELDTSPSSINRRAESPPDRR